MVLVVRYYEYNVRVSYNCFDTVNTMLGFLTTVRYYEYNVRVSYNCFDTVNTMLGFLTTVSKLT